jgi:hypothetical protein
MSKFLGPIHNWLYNKIEFQQEIIDEVCELGNEYGLKLKEESDNRYGVFENKPLEEVIDQSNIHGWLQEQVSQEEYKYAYCVNELLKNNPAAKDSLLERMKTKGIDLAIILKEYLLNAQGIYKAVNDYLLDGMPCDHANQVISQSEAEVVWAREVCVHTPYWESVGADIGTYYELRDAFLNGLVRELGYSYERIDDKTYCIKEIE